MKPIILVVEDEFLIARDIKNILQDEGYTVIIDIDAVDQAIAAIELHKPSLVITDINLKKDKDGIDLAKYLLLKDEIPYIYLTSFSDKITMDRVNDTRPYGYIVKPFKAIDITTTVAVVLNNFSFKRIDIQRNDETIENEVPFILKQTIDYINENITEKIEVSHLAQMTKWKSQYFQRLFTKYVGMTPYHYIINRKIERAKALLIETTLPTRQISYELGFLSHSNFCINFKKSTGQTPEGYRKQQDIKKRFL